MPHEIFPSSFECDCGHRSHFFEKKRVRLGDVAPDEHFIVFYQGKMVDIICPHGKSKMPSGQ
jgi:hypothetical protein